MHDFRCQCVIFIDCGNRAYVLLEVSLELIIFQIYYSEHIRENISWAIAVDRWIPMRMYSCMYMLIIVASTDDAMQVYIHLYIPLSWHSGIQLHVPIVFVSSRYVLLRLLVAITVSVAFKLDRLPIVCLSRCNFIWQARYGSTMSNLVSV